MGDITEIPQYHYSEWPNFQWAAHSDWWYSYMDSLEAESVTTRFPDIAVGRMSSINNSSTTAEVWAQVLNNIRYMRRYNQDWDFSRACYVFSKDQTIRNLTVGILQEHLNTEFSDGYFLDGLGQNATEALLNAELGRPMGSGLLLYAGHGLNDTWENWNWDNDDLTVGEVFSTIPARPQGLVCTFACNSANLTSPNRSIGEAFVQQSSGTPAVVGSSWSADDRYAAAMMYSMYDGLFEGDGLSDLGLVTQLMKADVEQQFMLPHEDPSNLPDIYQLQNNINAMAILGDPALSVRQPGSSEVALQVPPYYRVDEEDEFTASVHASSSSDEENFQIRIFYQDSLLHSGITDENGAFATKLTLPDYFAGYLRVSAFKPGYQLLGGRVILDGARPVISIDFNHPNNSWDISWEPVEGVDVCYHIYKSSDPYFNPQDDEGELVGTTTSTTYSVAFDNLYYPFEWFRVVAEYNCE